MIVGAFESIAEAVRGIWDQLMFDISAALWSDPTIAAGMTLLGIKPVSKTSTDGKGNGKFQTSDGSKIANFDDKDMIDGSKLSDIYKKYG